VDRRRDRLGAGITAWKARGVDLRSYLEGEVMAERAVRVRRDAIRAEYMDEEAEAETLENSQAVLSVRVPAALAKTLKMRAAEQHIPTSALIRRILTRAVREGTERVLTVEQVEEIARRVVRESV
jgi:plasmid stability protein